MTMLRELVASLGFKVDSKQFERADKAVNGIAVATQKMEGRLRDARGRFVAAGAAAGAAGSGGFATLANAAKGLATVLATGGIARGFHAMVEQASDAQETQNVLGEVLKENAQQVNDWAAEQSRAMGRSRFELAEMASQIAAVSQPMLQNREAAAEMSTGIAQLAVDLASFFNSTDAEALTALRAGLTGETEPLKRFGIVMLEANLQAFALSQGIQKNVKDMTIAEKTALRYQFILSATADAQGDAARTTNSYANAVKGMRAALIDVATVVGQAALPKVEAMVRFVRDGARRFEEFTRGSDMLSHALTALGIVAGLVATVMGVQLAAAHAGLIGKLLRVALLFSVFFVVLDEVLTLLKGGKTAVGDYLDSWLGLGTTDKLVRNHAAGVDFLSEKLQNLHKSVTQFFVDYDKWGQEVGEKIERSIEAAAEFVGADVSFEDERKWRRGEWTQKYGMGRDMGSNPGGPTRRYAKGRSVDADVHEVYYGRANISAIRAPQVLTAPAARAGSSTTNIVGGTTNVHVHGDVGGDKTIRRIREAGERELAATLRALQQGKE